MSEVNEFAGVHDEGVGRGNGIRYSSSAAVEAVGDWKFQVTEFAKGAAEMSVEFGKGVRDVVNQTVLREDSVIVKKLKGPCHKILGKLRFLNDYLPEDRDPVHAWTVIVCVWILALAVLLVNITQTTTPLVRKMKVHPASASIILLPDGRRLAYQEQGVPADQARYSMIVPHSFLWSRLSGIPGVKGALLEEFGIRLVTYDLPGFGESDPDPKRNLELSALDMLHLAYAVNVREKFWVLGYSDGSKHAWAALHYIPDRIAGAIMVAPMVNPYEPRLTKEESRRIWGKWTVKKKLMYFLARKFPRLLPYFYRRSFLSGNLDQIDTWLSVSLGKRDRAVVEDRTFQDFWLRNVEESVRQSNARPFVEEAVLQVSNWGFSIGDLNGQSKYKGEGILAWLKSLYTPADKRLSGFLGPIHIWQGDEDRVVPPSMSDYVQRDLPDAILHKLPYEGHFSYLYFCSECHRHIFTTVFGHPQGPLTANESRAPVVDEAGENAEAICSDAARNEERLSTLAQHDEFR
ncbi:alpha/beta-Hydrolases superfamily protein [Perilla frutescens var. frutescens]|nr:alpha/beta-Hydrolases superfamily protein [Perilla frutescens var. frutescens]